MSKKKKSVIENNSDFIAEDAEDFPSELEEFAEDTEDFPTTLGDVEAENFVTAAAETTAEAPRSENPPGDQPRGKKLRGGKSHARKPQESLPRRKKRRPGRRILCFSGWCVAGVQVVISAVLVSIIMRLGVLPEKYLAPVIALLILLAAVTACAQIPKKKALMIGGLGFGVIACAALTVGCVYLERTTVVLDSVTVEEEEDNYKVDNIVVAVLDGDRAQTMDDTLLYNFGIQRTIDRENTDKVIAEIEERAGIELSLTEYDDFSEMVLALRRGDIQAVIYNSAFNDTIEESMEGFTDEIRVLNSHEIKSAVRFLATDMNVAREPFTVYISGIDVYGDIEQSSRSDVNILVTVNPVTKKVVMTTTPRDYWVYLPEVSGNYRDKLTHAGLYGIQCSIDTLTALYGVAIDYYARVNFTTLTKLVDALGGINVYSEYAFTTHYKNGGYEIKQGYNEMNGKMALAFARERYNVPGGDEQRGRDQQEVLKALMEKAMSPSILTGYMGILDGLEGNFETNMRMNQIASLVKMQLGDGASWDIVMQAVSGTTGSEACFSGGYRRLSIMYEDHDSIVKARETMLANGASAVDPMGRFPDDTYETDIYGNIIYPETDAYGNPVVPETDLTGTDMPGNAYPGASGAGTSGGTGGATPGTGMPGGAYPGASGTGMTGGDSETDFLDSEPVEFDSSLGAFADSPTVRGEDGLIPGFNYYKQPSKR